MIFYFYLFICLFIYLIIFCVKRRVSMRVTLKNSTGQKFWHDNIIIKYRGLRKTVVGPVGTPSLVRLVLGVKIKCWYDHFDTRVLVSQQATINVGAASQKWKKELEWESLEERRKVSRVSILHQALWGRLAIPTQTSLRPVLRSSRHSQFIQIATNKNCLKYSFKCPELSLIGTPFPTHQRNWRQRQV